MSEGGEPDSELPEFSERTPVLVGTVIWAVVLVLSLIFRPYLVDHGHGWWVWAAVAGLGLGVFGFWFVNRRQARQG